jgi:hypothetical protein
MARCGDACAPGVEIETDRDSPLQPGALPPRLYPHSLRFRWSVSVVQDAMQAALDASIYEARIERAADQ